MLICMEYVAHDITVYITDYKQISISVKTLTIGQTHPNFLGGGSWVRIVPMRTFKNMRAARAIAPPSRNVLPIETFELPRTSACDAVQTRPSIPNGPTSEQMGAASAPFIYLRANTNTRTADVLVALQDIQAILNQHAEILLRVDAALKTSRRGRAQMGGTESASVDPNRMVDINFLSTLIGVNRSTIYAWIAAGKFVKQTPLSHGTSRWRLGEVEAWLDANREARTSKKCRSPLAAAHTHK